MFRRGKGRQVEQDLLGNRSFSFSLLPARQCSNYLAYIDEGAWLPNYHFITQCHGAVDGRTERAEHLLRQEINRVVRQDCNVMYNLTGDEGLLVDCI